MSSQDEDFVSGPSALLSLREDIGEELSFIVHKYSNFIVDNIATYYELLSVKNEVDILKGEYKKLHEKIRFERIHTDNQFHFNLTQKFLEFSVVTNASLSAFESQRASASAASNPQPNPGPVSTPAQQFHLPQIPLPTFNGEFSKWQAFSSTFTSIVTDNQSVSESVKLFYLRQSLIGEALARIENIALDDNGFQIAWKLLSERYDNKRLIASSHVSAIESPPPVKKNSAQSLRKFIDHCKSNINALEALKLGVEIKDLLYMHKLLSQLDIDTVRDWERHIAHDKVPTLKEFWNFLESQCKVIDAVSSNSSNNNQKQSTYQPSNVQVTKQNFNRTQAAYQPNTNYQSNFKSSANTSCYCSFCKESSHVSHRCPTLLNLHPQKRLEAVKSKHLCFNCLRSYQPDHSCSSRSCFHCGKAHHSILHEAYTIQDQQGKGKNVTTNIIHSSNQRSSGRRSPKLVTANQSNSHSASTSIASQCTDEGIKPPTSIDVHSNVAATVCLYQQASISVLPTAEILVMDSKKNLIKCTALLDSGSDCNLISQRLADKLLLSAIVNETVIHSIGSQSKSCMSYSILVKSTDQQWSSQESCIVIDKIPSRFSNAKIDVENLEIPSHIALADPSFHKAKDIDLLLGAGVFASVLSAAQIVTSKGSPVIQATRLGWIVFGSCKVSAPPTVNSHVSNFLSSISMDNTSHQLEKFWELESVMAQVPLTSDIAFTEKHYEEHTHRQEDGRFIVALPRRESFHTLGNSRFQALKRFKSLEQRLAKNVELKAQYTEFMKEYEDLHHMSPVAQPTDDQKVYYYIPHHPVFKLDSTTTKLRVVFDCSAKTSTGISLNEVLHTGHTVQPELFEIVLRFRTHLIAFIADITKMYRQILLEPSDRNLHRIFWRDDPHKPLTEYCLNTVTYGSAPAAFLATRTLNELADLEANDDTLISHAIKNDFYVDDLISGCNSLEQAVVVSQKLISTLNKGGFQLRKWMSNSAELLDTIPPHLIETSSTKAVADTNDSVAKALGLIWNSTADLLSISSSVKDIAHKESFTKRQFLSCVASIFDPLGLISPIVITPKILFQELWLSRIGWDDPLPPVMLNKWLKILQDLHFISDITIPRCVISKDADTVFELHGFSDASLSAYGACLYVRSLSSNGIKIHLLCSKSRVAPLKSLSVPRLELCAAHLLSRLINKVINAIKLPISNVFLWSDSQTVCDWIKTPPDRKNIFCSTRISEIQESTSSFHWNHVRTKNNPADIISRGCSPLELMHNELWWSGPSWLSSPRESWDSFSSNVIFSQSTHIVLAVKSNPSVLSNLFLRCSNFHKIVRSSAYVLRYLHNLRNPQNKYSGFLSVEEVTAAEIHLIKAVQADAFYSELKDLRASGELSATSALQAFTPFIDAHGLLRVGGRLELADIPYDTKHQIILPSKHKFTSALIFSYHRRLSHAGVQVTMANLRQRYWIISTRRTIKGVLRSCKMCFRFSLLRSEQIMGQLPSVRTKIAFPFYTCGVDYAGPISIRLGGPKSRTFSKAYIALFVCMVTRAIHVEIVSELSSNAFIAALIRFASRRGIPHSICSDNATTFHGANNDLKELFQFLSSNKFQNEIHSITSTLNIQWHFIPPRAPHFGGIWENAIKNFKRTLRNVTFKKILNFEELTTFAAQTEAILNSRPLVPLSEDPSDLSYLSPGHFLIGRPLTALPFTQPVTKHVDHVSRWRHLATATQTFWDRWSQDYLVTLQKKNKWTSPSENIKVGAIVMLKDPGTIPSDWKLAKIIEVHPGKDGKVRVVTVFTPAGTFKRAISSIAPLPQDDDVENASIS